MGTLAAILLPSARPAIARELLGHILVHETAEGTTSGGIVEMKTFHGEHHLACHAAIGLTSRTKWAFSTPGTTYVYFAYGVPRCCIAVTRAERSPSAVLIRALDPLEGLELMRRGGVRARLAGMSRMALGKLCEALRISGAQNGLDLGRFS
jgi:DNA-3-methyladenine glycosylase